MGGVLQLTLMLGVIGGGSGSLVLFEMAGVPWTGVFRSEVSVRCDVGVGVFSPPSTKEFL